MSKEFKQDLIMVGVAIFLVVSLFMVMFGTKAEAYEVNHLMMPVCTTTPQVEGINVDHNLIEI